MKKSTLKLAQVLALAVEVNGTPEYPGLLSEPISHKTKYWLNKLMDVLTKEHEAYEKIRVELVQKYGDTDNDGNTQVNEKSKDFQKFLTEINEILSQEIELEHGQFTIDDLDFKSERNYPIFSSLI